MFAQWSVAGTSGASGQADGSRGQARPPALFSVGERISFDTCSALLPGVCGGSVEQRPRVALLALLLLHRYADHRPRRRVLWILWMLWMLWIDARGMKQPGKDWPGSDRTSADWLGANME
jgi:hypothetical protein